MPAWVERTIAFVAFAALELVVPVRKRLADMALELVALELDSYRTSAEFVDVAHELVARERSSSVRVRTVYVLQFPSYGISGPSLS